MNSDPFANVAGPYFDDIMDLKSKMKSSYVQMTFDSSDKCLISAEKARFSDRSKLKNKDYLVSSIYISLWYGYN